MEAMQGLGGWVVAVGAGLVGLLVLGMVFYEQILVILAWILHLLFVLGLVAALSSLFLPQLYAWSAARLVEQSGIPAQLREVDALVESVRSIPRDVLERLRSPLRSSWAALFGDASAEVQAPLRPVPPPYWRPAPVPELPAGGPPGSAPLPSPPGRPRAASGSSAALPGVSPRPRAASPSAPPSAPVGPLEAGIVGLLVDGLGLLLRVVSFVLGVTLMFVGLAFRSTTDLVLQLRSLRGRVDHLEVRARERPSSGS